ncbi:MAG: hypothetical protein QOK14_1062, partial [Frankiaceae bacterium]|nr:hypothetical protein [Frankiaceae bacterium]
MSVRVPRGVAERIPEPALQSLRAVRRHGRLLAGRLTSPPGPARPPVRADAAARVLIGPANFAGQAWAWARAAERHLDDVDAVVMTIAGGGLGFDSDYAVPPKVFHSRRWQTEQYDWIAGSFTHVFVDAMRSILGTRYGPDCGRELPVLAGAGVRVGLVAHGSDIRLGSRHRELYPWSPWNDPTWAHGARLEAQARRLGAVLTSYDGPTFVSTPDLLDFAPVATWL